MPLTCSYTVVSQPPLLPQTQEKKQCVWKGMLGEERAVQVLLKHHLTLAPFQSALADSHSHIPPAPLP